MAWLKILSEFDTVARLAARSGEAGVKLREIIVHGGLLISRVAITFRGIRPTS